VGFLVAGLVFVCAVTTATLAVICIVQSFTGRQVFRPESSPRSPTQIKRGSRWAAGEWSATAVGLTALLFGSDPLLLVCVLVAVACFVGLLRDRRAHSPSV
jgi:cytochrome c biogenesis factor